MWSNKKYIFLDVASDHWGPSHRFLRSKTKNYHGKKKDGWCGCMSTPKNIHTYIKSYAMGHCGGKIGATAIRRRTLRQTPVCQTPVHQTLVRETTV
jgi:hypothetical protein